MSFIRSLTYIKTGLTVCALALSITMLSMTPASAAIQDKTDAVCKSQRPILLRNDRGNCVNLAQRLLVTKGVFHERPNGVFGPATAASVNTLQKQSGIAQVGQIGPKTWNILLGSSPSTPKAANTSLPAKCQTTGKSICIVKSTNSQATLYAVQNKAIVKSMPARTGDARGASYATTIGSFSVGRKYVDYTSKAYNAPMPYSMFFNGGQAIHYSQQFAEGRGFASHGCVNLKSRADAKSLYEWTPRGTPVIVTR